MFDRLVVDRIIIFFLDSMEKVFCGFYDFCVRKVVVFEDVEVVYVVVDELVREYFDR